MIFLTVGSELPFDRLVRAVDDWCATHDRHDVFGQIADPGAQGYRPANFEWKSFLEPEEFKNHFQQADFVVAHAGMGSIITALTLSKPVVVMARQVKFRETRNDHQLATIEQFVRRAGVYAATEEKNFARVLDEVSQKSSEAGTGAASPFAEQRLLDAIHQFIHDKSSARP